MKRALVALTWCLAGGMALAKPEISWSEMHPTAIDMNVRQADEPVFEPSAIDF